MLAAVIFLGLCAICVATGSFVASSTIISGYGRFKPGHDPSDVNATSSRPHKHDLSLVGVRNETLETDMMRAIWEGISRFFAPSHCSQIVCALYEREIDTEEFK
jgi:hypothetical protein